LKRYHSRYSLTRIILAILGSLAIPATWWALKVYLNVSDRFLPSLEAVYGAIFSIDPSLGVHTFATVMRLLIGFVAGTIVGILVGVFLARWATVDAFFSPAIHALRAVPASAAVPFFLLWFGFSETGRYLLVLLAVGLNVAVASRQILARHSRPHLTFFASFGLSPGALPLRYSVPKIADEILPTLRFSLALSIGAVTISELLGSQLGLGYLLQSGRSTFSLHLMFLAMIVIGVVASIADFALRVGWNKLLYWKEL
jgi:ABC-type nitrate/sulfonate/bicarbonate transport system permease component